MKIGEIDMKKITTVIQKARMKMALSDAIKPEEEIPEELQKEYNKFLQEEGLQGEDLEEELRKTRTETGALSNILTNIIAMQSTIIQDLKFRFIIDALTGNALFIIIFGKFFSLLIEFMSYFIIISKESLVQLLTRRS